MGDVKKVFRPPSCGQPPNFPFPRLPFMLCSSDESPMAYKDAEGIVAALGPTAEIVDRLRPLYNFKAGGE